jgi:hypothetical protein
MDFGLIPALDKSRYCYLPPALLKEFWKEEAILDGLLDQLEVPGKRVHQLPLAEKQAAIEAQIEHFRNARTSVWYQVPSLEVFAASVFRASGDSLPKKAIQTLFRATRKEADLAPAVMEWIRAQDLEPTAEVPLGAKRVDVLGYREGGFFSSDHVVCIEMKNELLQLRRGLDQMTTFAEYAHATYLACTPYLAASYLDHHAEAKNVTQWDPQVLNRKVEAFGFGLLLVEGTQVTQLFAPKERSPDSGRIEELKATLKAIGARAA